MQGKKLTGILSGTLLVLMLSACTPGPKATPGGIYQCSYKNTATNHIYYALDAHEFNAVQKSYYACENGPANWSCYFRYCVQVKQ